MVLPCPKNWRLPRTTTLGTAGGPSSNLNEFWNLNQSQNNGLTNTDSGLRTNWLGVRAGIVSGDNFAWVGSEGFYWSSTVSSTPWAPTLSFWDTLVSPANNCNRIRGQSVRCVLD